MKRIFTCICGFIAVAAGVLCGASAQAAESPARHSAAPFTVEDICTVMYMQYPQFYEYYWFNGEPWLSMFYGEVTGQDYISLFWMRGYPQVPNWIDMTDKDSWGARIAWDYCYNLITLSNILVASAENNTSNKEEAFICAQGLTFRAHAYLRLLQIYGPRWEDRYDSSGSEVATVPIVLTPEAENLNDIPSATMGVVLDRIYDDLNRAIELYTFSGLKRAEIWEPDISVCKGIYARAAMLKHDWNTAATMAREARQDYPLMTADEYLAGFAEPTSEWIWCDNGNIEHIFYASFGATYACNGTYPCLWGTIGAGAIDYMLQKQAGSRDRRSELFYSPINSFFLPDFWGDGCDPQTMNIAILYSRLCQDFVDFANVHYQRVGVPNDWLPPYTEYGFPLSYGDALVTAQFGAQFKFWGTDEYGTSKFPFMRASEMLLIEAEALWENGDDARARDLLNELNINRYRTRSNGASYYNPLDSSGEELLNDIKFYRRLELWGEGFSWFDFKRWNQPIERTAWKRGDRDSGNWPEAFAGVFPTDRANGWRWSIPEDREPIEADGVGEIQQEDNKLPDIYMINGVCVKRNATESDIKALNPGFYIIGGKKVIIR